MSTIKITEENFNEEVINSKKTVLLDFWAPWCGPCRMVAPILDKIADERDDVTIGKVNVDEEDLLSSKFGIVSIPTFVVMKGGKILSESVGFKSKEEILELMEV